MNLEKLYIKSIKYVYVNTMTIEDLDDILREIETKSISHPNLTRVWIEYLNIKKQKLENLVKGYLNI